MTKNIKGVGNKERVCVSGTGGEGGEIEGVKNEAGKVSGKEDGRTKSAICMFRCSKNVFYHHSEVVEICFTTTHTPPLWKGGKHRLWW
jgi:hypothetical protein